MYVLLYSVSLFLKIPNISHLFFLEKPSPPPRFGVTDVTKDSISLSWSKPEHDGGSRITSYLIDALEKGQQKWVKCAVVKSTSHTVRSLRENAEYFFRVRAENHAGLSDPKEMIVPVVVKDQLGKQLLLLCDYLCFKYQIVF